MAWWILVAAGFLEVGWAIGLKYTAGFTRLVPSLLTIMAIVASMFLLSIAARSLPIGTAYAVWSASARRGPGCWESCSSANRPVPARLFFLTLLLVAIVGLRWAEG